MGNSSSKCVFVCEDDNSLSFEDASDLILRSITEFQISFQENEKTININFEKAKIQQNKISTES
jgi:hypothetical protein